MKKPFSRDRELRELQDGSRRPRRDIPRHRSLETALKDAEELLREVADGSFLPKKFRAKGMSDSDKFTFLTYLQREIDGMRHRLSATNGHVTEVAAPQGEKS